MSRAVCIPSWSKRVLFPPEYFVVYLLNYDPNMAQTKNIKQEIGSYIRMREDIIYKLEMGEPSFDLVKAAKGLSDAHANIFQKIQTVFRVMLDQIGHGDKKWAMSIPHLIRDIDKDGLEVDEAMYLDFSYARVGGKKPGLSHVLYLVLNIYDNEIPFSWLNMTQPKLKAAIREVLQEKAKYYRKRKDPRLARWLALFEKAGF